MRATEAMRLMEEGRSVEEVSDLLNFSSVGYFSFFFKKYFGQPPSFFKN
jgi:AraC-like DNA-binding protein